MSSFHIKHLILSGNALTSNDMSQLITAAANSESGTLQYLRFEATDIRCPLDTRLLDSIAAKLRHNAPLKECRFSVYGEEDIDKEYGEGLRKMWIDRWPETGEVEIIESLVTMKLKEKD